MEDVVDQHTASSGIGLRMCAWATAACVVVAVLGAAGLSLHGVLVSGSGNNPQAGLGFAVGVGVATASFGLSALVIAWADLVERRLILPVGLLTYVLKIVAIGLVVFALARGDWPSFVPLLWGIAIGTATWVATQAVWVYGWATKQ